MIIMNLVTLVVNAFIELNKIENIRKIYLNDIINFSNVIKNESINKGYTYIANIDSTNFYDLKFNYSMFFNTYEDENGYVISLANSINVYDLYDYFKPHENEELQDILDNINFKDIFPYFKKDDYKIKLDKK